MSWNVCEREERRAVEAWLYSVWRVFSFVFLQGRGFDRERKSYLHVNVSFRVDISIRYDTDTAATPLEGPGRALARFPV